MDYITLLSIIAFSVIFTSHIEPWEYIKRKYGLFIGSPLRSKIRWVNLIIMGLKKILNCPSCLSFWITLIVFKDIRVAMCIYLLTFYISTHINEIRL